MFAWSDCCCCCCCWSAGDVTLGWRQQLPPPWQVVAQEWRIMPKNPSLSFHFLGRMSQHGFSWRSEHILWGFAGEKGETLAAGSFALGGREGGGRARNQQWSRPLLTIYWLSSILALFTLAPYYILALLYSFYSCSLLFALLYSGFTSAQMCKVYKTEYSSLLDLLHWKVLLLYIVC